MIAPQREETPESFPKVHQESLLCSSHMETFIIEYSSGLIFHRSILGNTELKYTILTINIYVYTHTQSQKF